MSVSTGPPCPCTEASSSTEGPLTPHCVCPRDEHDIIIHEETCLLYKNEKIIFPHEPEVCECYSPPFESGVCECCGCLPDQCFCRRAGREAFDEWRGKRDIGALPAVLESTHPLMQKFQDNLRKFLEKENALAEAEIINLRDELRTGKLAYNKDLETIYQGDHDTNAQRVLIEEYEQLLAKKSEERNEMEQRKRVTTERYRKVKEQLEQDSNTEREAIQELEALTNLCRQLESWREETESDLTVSQRVSDKMRAQKLAMADEKRQLDMVIYSLSNEVWKLEYKLELFQKQFEIKNNEMEKVNDRVTAYSTELEDLELDKRRLMSLWNSVVVNITRRDNIFDSVREDYKALQENYRTLVVNLGITKKVTMDEMNRGKEMAMNKDRIMYDMNSSAKLFESEDAKRVALEQEIADTTDAIEMSEKDQEMITMENNAMKNVLQTTSNDLDRKTENKLKLESEILQNLQDCLLNNKATDAMASGIKKMREMSRKLEIGLQAMENQHAKVMLDIEVNRNRQAKNAILQEKNQEKVRNKEKELELLQDKFDQKALVLTRKQREMDIVLKKYTALKEIYALKSPQERRIEELEQQIKDLRERTESMQQEWLRLQGHVVKLTQQHQKLVADISLINKQIQICDQKKMRINANFEKLLQDRHKVETSLRELRGRLEVLERTRKEANERNQGAHLYNLTVTHEYAANLKGAEGEIIDLEEAIEELEKEKINLTQELDRMQREALIWQRKGILAVELKRNIKNAKSTVGEIGQMKTEIHRMEVRREQLRRMSEQLAEDLALYVTRRDTAMEKTRASAAVEKAHGCAGNTSQSTYHHKLRLARADVVRVTKDLNEAKANLAELQQEQARLEGEVKHTAAVNSQLEESVATLLRECRHTERQKQWLLERVVRSQRLGSELATAVKRQSLRLRKPKSAVLADYNQATALNDRIKFIVESLAKEHPYLEEKFEAILNTLNIHSPEGSPRLTEDAPSLCASAPRPEDEDSENVAEKPLEDGSRDSEDWSR